MNTKRCLTNGVACAPKVSDPLAPCPLPFNFRIGSGVKEGPWVRNSLNPILSEGIDPTSLLAVFRVTVFLLVAYAWCPWLLACALSEGCSTRGPKSYRLIVYLIHDPRIRSVAASHQHALRAGPERSHVRDATIPEGMRAEALGVTHPISMDAAQLDGHSVSGLAVRPTSSPPGSSAWYSSCKASSRPVGCWRLRALGRLRSRRSDSSPAILPICWCPCLPRWRRWCTCAWWRPSSASGRRALARLVQLITHCPAPEWYLSADLLVKDNVTNSEVHTRIL